MSQVATAIQGQYPATPQRRKRKHWNKLPRHGFDRRTRIGRRALTLAALYRERLGSDAADPLLANAIERAAHLVALCEDLTARSLRGQDIPPDDVVRLNRLCDLQLRRLKLDRHQPPATESVADYLARTYGREDAA